MEPFYEKLKSNVNIIMGSMGVDLLAYMKTYHKAHSVDGVLQHGSITVGQIHLQHTNSNRLTFILPLVNFGGMHHRVKEEGKRTSFQTQEKTTLHTSERASSIAVVNLEREATLYQ